MLGGDITLRAVRKIEQRGLRDGKREGATLVRGGVFMSGTLFVHQFLDNFSPSLTPSLDQGNKLYLTISQYSLFQEVLQISEYGLKNAIFKKKIGGHKKKPWWALFCSRAVV